ncbi:LxmA leader domain family RiPP [Nocardioides zeae]|uniref:LxmA leader domain family RiPP n=1 Tax=Nocardioides imazamoxiresistens TaxID=3231893 RepID=A0ABU3PV51_9ACTN|nr:LxmA leader domain family RiPP [Nocardioides zeae]MDT9593111.1 LxmA leader domain family RiPP [Nocardioides zeae]
MSTHDLIAGYAAYTEASELGHADDAAAVTPTTATTSSAGCAASVGASIYFTVSKGC